MVRAREVVVALTAVKFWSVVEPVARIVANVPRPPEVMPPAKVLVVRFETVRLVRVVVPNVARIPDAPIDPPLTVRPFDEARPPVERPFVNVEVPEF